VNFEGALFDSTTGELALVREWLGWISQNCNNLEVSNTEGLGEIATRRSSC